MESKLRLFVIFFTGVLTASIFWHGYIVNEKLETPYYMEIYTYRDIIYVDQEDCISFETNSEEICFDNKRDLYEFISDRTAEDAIFSHVDEQGFDRDKVNVLEDISVHLNLDSIQCCYRGVCKVLDNVRSEGDGFEVVYY